MSGMVQRSLTKSTVRTKTRVFSGAPLLQLWCSGMQSPVNRHGGYLCSLPLVVWFVLIQGNSPPPLPKDLQVVWGGLGGATLTVGSAGLSRTLEASLKCSDISHIRILSSRTGSSSRVTYETLGASAAEYCPV